jgi:hypothetical protein
VLIKGAAKCDPDALTFSSVRVPQTLLANGQLAPGALCVSRQVNSGRGPIGDAECWVVVQAGIVAGREIASVVSSDHIVEKTCPEPSALKFDTLKRIRLQMWINSCGTHYFDSSRSSLALWGDPATLEWHSG